MNHKRHIDTLFAMAILIVGPAIAFAHNGIEHVMGTVTAVTDTSITVDTVKHKSVTVMVDSSTTFSHKEMKMALKDLKVGERVVINAKESAEKKLQAVSVKWGASANPSKDHADHK